MNEKTKFDINFGMLVHALVRGFWLLLACAIIGAGIAYAYISFFVEPIYSSTATLYIGNSTGDTNYSDVNMSGFLAKDYEVIIKRRAVLDEVVTQLDMSIPASELKDYVSINNVSDTRILDITVSMSDPALAKKVADTICTVASDKLVSTIKVDYISIVDWGSMPSSPSNINLALTMVLAAMLGFLISAFVIIVRVLMDDKLKTPDDVEHYLGLTVIGTMPFTKGIESDIAGVASIKRRLMGKGKVH